MNRILLLAEGSETEDLLLLLADRLLSERLLEMDS